MPLSTTIGMTRRLTRLPLLSIAKIEIVGDGLSSAESIENKSTAIAERPAVDSQMTALYKTPARGSAAEWHHTVKRLEQRLREQHFQTEIAIIQS